MVEYSKDTQLKKLKTAVKNNARTTLRMSFKMLDGKICLMNCYWLQDKELSKEIHLITTRQLI